MNGGWLVVFAILAGFTASGVVASLYRVVASAMHLTPDSRAGLISRAAVMIVAGPSVLLETAVRKTRAKKWHIAFFWIITVLVCYWSFALGLFIIDIAIHI